MLTLEFEPGHDIFHLFGAERIEPDYEHGEEGNSGRDEGHEHPETFYGACGLDYAHSLVGIGAFDVAAAAEKPHDCRAADGSAEFLGHRGRGEDEAGRGRAGFQFGVVADIGIHWPYERRHHACEHRDDYLEQEHHQQTAVWLRREGEEDHAEDDEQGVDQNEGGFLAESVGDGHCESHSYHVGNLADSEEEAGVEEKREWEDGYVLFASDDVGEEECHSGTAHGVEEVEAERGSVEKPPGFVGQQRLEVFAEWGRADGGELLAGEVEAQEEEDKAAGCYHYHGKLPAALERHAHRGGEELAEGIPGEEGYEGASVGEEHAEGWEDGLFLRVVGHDSEHGSIGDVDAGVDGHHEDVGDVGPYEFGCIAPVRGGEQEYAADWEGGGHPQQVGAVFAPAGLGAVGDDAHHGVRDGVPDAGDEQEHTGVYKTYAEYVGIEKREVVAEDFPEHGRGHVTEAVAYFFF